MTIMTNAASEISSISNLIDSAFETQRLDDLLQMLNYPDLFDSSDLYQLIETIEETYGDPDAPVFASGMQLERIAKDSNLYGWLRSWYGRNGGDVDFEMARNMTNFVETDDAIYYMHGYGYDAISKDLLGGGMDGEATRKFYDFVNAQ